MERAEMTENEFILKAGKAFICL